MASRPGPDLRAGKQVENPGRQQLLERLGRIGARVGTRTFLVGGPVRDMIAGRASPDTDVAVESHSRRFGTAVADELDGRFVYHSRFMTGTVRRGDGTHIDVSQTRTETYSRPGVLPDVKPSSIKDDLVRRDFTMNAMAMELSPAAFGDLIDPLGGRADIAGRVVRVLHDRSFSDDPTRIFRCIRFAIRLGFEIEPHTLELMRAAVAARRPALLTPERVLYELRLICAEPLVLPMVEALVRERVLESTWPWRPGKELLPDLARLVRGKVDAGLLYIYLLSRLPVTDRFPILKEERAAADWLNRFTSVRARLGRSRRHSTIYRLLSPIPESTLQILAVLEPEPSSRRIRIYLEQLARVRTSVTGRDLRAMGVAPGPRYRRILEAVLCARLDGSVRSRIEELAFCRRRAGRSDH